jgi:transposase
VFQGCLFSVSTALLPDPTQLRLIGLSASETLITVAVSTTGQEARCPRCHRPSSRVHRRYQRTLADLPWGGVAVRLCLHARRFFCDDVAGERQIFTERIPTVAAPSARRTTRLAGWCVQVAFALGGAPGARLLRRGGCATSRETSRETLLDAICAFTSAPPWTPTVLSVDDFAVRNGRTYGTILVDLERHRVVDLVPDRSAGAVAAWRREHPGVQIVSRDRGGESADGVKQGAPAAVQVADRFHLLRTAGDVARRVLPRHAAVAQRLPAPGAAAHGLSRLRLDRDASRAQTRATMRHHAPPCASGLSRRMRWQPQAGGGRRREAIARRLGLNRKTVDQYLSLQAAPHRRHASRSVSALAPYEGYLLRVPPAPMG